MATKNPKISVYVPDDIKEKLKGKKKELRSNSLSAVVVSILEEYFGIASPQSSAVSKEWVEQTNARLDSLERETSKISKLINAQEEKSSSLSSQTFSSQQIPLPIDKKIPNRNEAKNEIQEDNTFIVSTGQAVELTGITKSRLEKAKQRDRFPIHHEKWQVLSCEGKERIDGRLTNTWKVTRL